MQTLVSRVRAIGGRNLIETWPSGYRLAVSAEQIDAGAFQLLVQRTYGAAPESAVDLLAAAERLWRGPAFAGQVQMVDVQAEVAWLDEMRLVARERRCRALLDLDRCDDAISELEGLAAGHPRGDTVVARLIEGLARTGRTAEALRRFSDYRAALARTTGLDPSPELIIAPSARRQLAQTLPEAVAFAAYELIVGPLPANPHRLGKPLQPPLHYRISARRGTYRVISESTTSRSR